MFKVPMQCIILFTGVMVFVFYLFVQPPIFFNRPVLDRLEQAAPGAELAALKQRYDQSFAHQRSAAAAYIAALPSAAGEPTAKAELRAAAAQVQAVRQDAKALISSVLPDAEPKDTDYVFLTFVLDYVPSGLIGLLIAAILCAAMSSTSSELAALGSTTTVDLYRRIRRKPASTEHDLWASKLFTTLWGLVAVAFATFASLLDNLIEAVNIFGSIFYGTVLGIFLVAFFVRRVTSGPVLLAALIAQASVIVLFLSSDLGFLWYNVVGSGIVVVLSMLFELARAKPAHA